MSALDELQGLLLPEVALYSFDPPLTKKHHLDCFGKRKKKAKFFEDN